MIPTGFAGTRALDAPARTIALVTQKILIIGPAWIGDMVMAQSLFLWLRHLRQDILIDVAAPDWCIELLRRMPEVRRAIPAVFAHGEFAARRRIALGRSLRDEGYDQAIVLPNSWKSAIAPFAARIPLRTGWSGEMRHGLLNDLRYLRKDRFPLMIDRFNALAFDAGTIESAADFPQNHPCPSLATDPASREIALRSFGLSSERPVLALCPGAEFGPAKRWPARSYAEVARRRIASGWQVWLFGSPADAAIGASILDALPADERTHGHNLCGRTRLGEAIDLMSAVDLVVTNDSGLMHVAAALGRPLVAVYGSTSPEHTPPLASSRRIVGLDLPCRPCFKRECPLGHTDCLETLPPDMVLRALDELESGA